MGTERIIKRRRRTEFRRRERALRALLNEWDPIGVALDGPEDEYDCLIAPVLQRLKDGVPAAELTAFLATQLEEHFGLRGDATDIVEFATRAKAWFAER
jgi:hypothetical protein